MAQRDARAGLTAGGGGNGGGFGRPAGGVHSGRLLESDLIQDLLGRQIIEVWPPAPEVVRSQILTLDFAKGCALDSDGMVSRHFARSLDHLLYVCRADAKDSRQLYLRTYQAACSQNGLVNLVHAHTVAQLDASI